MASPSESDHQLWIALGGSDFSEPNSRASANRLRSVPLRSAISFNRLFAESEKNVPTETRLCLGYFEQQKVGLAWKLGNLQCETEYADAGRGHHNQWRAAAVNFCVKLRECSGMYALQHGYTRAPADVSQPGSHSSACPGDIPVPTRSHCL